MSRITITSAPKNPRLKHGHSRSSKQRSREYESWLWMREVCFNENHRSYKYFGHLGITIVARWSEYVKFYLDMGPKPPESSIKLIDPRKPFGPGNCRWRLDTEPRGPTNAATRVTFEGETLTTSEWMQRFEMPRTSFYRMLGDETKTMADIAAYAKARKEKKTMARRAELGIENPTSP